MLLLSVWGLCGGMRMLYCLFIIVLGILLILVDIIVFCMVIVFKIDIGNVFWWEVYIKILSFFNNVRILFIWLWKVILLWIFNDDV